MKKMAIAKLIKDLIMAGVMCAIATMILASSMGTGNALMLSLCFAGLPFGWRTISKIVTALTFEGILLKALFSIALGWVALPVVLVSDLIGCLVCKSAEAA